MVAGDSRRRGRGPHVGVALSPTSMCAAISTPGSKRTQPWRTSIEPINGDGSTWAGLTDALRALARETGPDGRLSIALLPPLAEARGIELPPVGEREAQQLLARGAGRYFAAARGAQVVGAVRVPAGGKDGKQLILAVAAPVRTLSAIHDAARGAGWSVESIVPAEAAWAAAGTAWSGKRASTMLVVAHERRTDALHVRGNALAGIRRFRPGGADAELIVEAALAARAGVAVVGEPSARRELVEALADNGISAEAPVASVASAAEDPDYLAAAFAITTAGPRLVTETERAARAWSLRRVTTRMAIAAGVLLVIAGLVEFWGIKRELNSVQAQRAALRPDLTTTLVGRTTVETAYQQLAVLAESERTAPEWSTVIAGISERLPVEAYLTGFRGHGDSVAVDGFASSAARVFNALDRVAGLSNVRATAPVRLETPSDGPPVERFTISAFVGDPPAAGRGAATSRATTARGSSRQ